MLMLRARWSACFLYVGELLDEQHCHCQDVVVPVKLQMAPRDLADDSKWSRATYDLPDSWSGHGCKYICRLHVQKQRS